MARRRMRARRIFRGLRETGNRSAQPAQIVRQSHDLAGIMDLHRQCVARLAASPASTSANNERMRYASYGGNHSP